MQRETTYQIDSFFKERYSPRMFSDKKPELSDINASIEAASTAPSCFNEQPWRYFIAYDNEDVALVKSTLASANELWNKPVQMYIVLLSSDIFEKNGKENPYSWFDSGTAWGFFTMEAHKRGLITHAMAGFSKKDLKRKLCIESSLSVIALIAVGYLHEEALEHEKPNSRKPIEKIIVQKEKCDGNEK